MSSNSTALASSPQKNVDRRSSLAAKYGAIVDVEPFHSPSESPVGTHMSPIGLEMRVVPPTPAEKVEASPTPSPLKGNTGKPSAAPVEPSLPPTTTSTNATAVSPAVVSVAVATSSEANQAPLNSSLPSWLQFSDGSSPADQVEAATLMKTGQEGGEGERRASDKKKLPKRKQHVEKKNSKDGQADRAFTSNNKIPESGEPWMDGSSEATGTATSSRAPSTAATAANDTTLTTTFTATTNTSVTNTTTTTIETAETAAEVPLLPETLGGESTTTDLLLDSKEEEHLQQATFQPVAGSRVGDNTAWDDRTASRKTSKTFASVKEDSTSTGPNKGGQRRRHSLGPKAGDRHIGRMRKSQSMNQMRRPTGGDSLDLGEECEVTEKSKSIGNRSDQKSSSRISDTSNPSKGGRQSSDMTSDPSVHSVHTMPERKPKADKEKRDRRKKEKMKRKSKECEDVLDKNQTIKEDAAAQISDAPVAPQPVDSRPAWISASDSTENNDGNQAADVVSVGAQKGGVASQKEIGTTTNNPINRYISALVEEVPTTSTSSESGASPPREHKNDDDVHADMKEDDTNKKNPEKLTIKVAGSPVQTPSSPPPQSTEETKQPVQGLSNTFNALVEFTKSPMGFSYNYGDEEEGSGDWASHTFTNNNNNSSPSVDNGAAAGSPSSQNTDRRATRAFVESDPSKPAVPPPAPAPTTIASVEKPEEGKPDEQKQEPVLELAPQTSVTLSTAIGSDTTTGTDTLAPIPMTGASLSSRNKEDVIATAVSATLSNFPLSTNSGGTIAITGGLAFNLPVLHGGGGEEDGKLVPVTTNEGARKSPYQLPLKGALLAAAAAATEGETDSQSGSHTPPWFRDGMKGGKQQQHQEERKHQEEELPLPIVSVSEGIPKSDLNESTASFTSRANNLTDGYADAQWLSLGIPKGHHHGPDLDAESNAAVSWSNQLMYSASIHTNQSNQSGQPRSKYTLPVPSSSKVHSTITTTTASKGNTQSESQMMMDRSNSNSATRSGSASNSTATSNEKRANRLAQTYRTTKRTQPQDGSSSRSASALMSSQQSMSMQSREPHSQMFSGHPDRSYGTSESSGGRKSPIPGKDFSISMSPWLQLDEEGIQQADFTEPSQDTVDSDGGSGRKTQPPYFSRTRDHVSPQSDRPSSAVSCHAGLQRNLSGTYKRSPPLNSPTVSAAGSRTECVPHTHRKSMGTVAYTQGGPAGSRSAAGLSKDVVVEDISVQEVYAKGLSSRSNLDASVVDIAADLDMDDSFSRKISFTNHVSSLVKSRTPASGSGADESSDRGNTGDDEGGNGRSASTRSRSGQNADCDGEHDQDDSDSDLEYAGEDGEEHYDISTVSFDLGNYEDAQNGTQDGGTETSVQGSTTSRSSAKGRTSDASLSLQKQQKQESMRSDASNGSRSLPQRSSRSKAPRGSATKIYATRRTRNGGGSKGSSTPLDAGLPQNSTSSMYMDGSMQMGASLYNISATDAELPTAQTITTTTTSIARGDGVSLASCVFSKTDLAANMTFDVSTPREYGSESELPSAEINNFDITTHMIGTSPLANPSAEDMISSVWDVSLSDSAPVRRPISADSRNASILISTGVGTGKVRHRMRGRRSSKVSWANAHGHNLNDGEEFTPTTDGDSGSPGTNNRNDGAGSRREGDAKNQGGADASKKMSSHHSDSKDADMSVAGFDSTDMKLQYPMGHSMVALSPHLKDIGQESGTTDAHGPGNAGGKPSTPAESGNAASATATAPAMGKTPPHPQKQIILFSAEEDGGYVESTTKPSTSAGGKHSGSKGSNAKGGAGSGSKAHEKYTLLNGLKHPMSAGEDRASKSASAGASRGANSATGSAAATAVPSSTQPSSSGNTTGIGAITTKLFKHTVGPGAGTSSSGGNATTTSTAATTTNSPVGVLYNTTSNGNRFTQGAENMGNDPNNTTSLSGGDRRPATAGASTGASSGTGNGNMNRRLSQGNNSDAAAAPVSANGAHTTVPTVKTVQSTPADATTSSPVGSPTATGTDATASGLRRTKVVYGTRITQETLDRSVKAQHPRVTDAMMTNVESPQYVFPTEGGPHDENVHPRGEGNDGIAPAKIKKRSTSKSKDKHGRGASPTTGPRKTHQGHATAAALQAAQKKHGAVPAAVAWGLAQGPTKRRGHKDGSHAAPPPALPQGGDATFHPLALTPFDADPNANSMSAGAGMLTSLRSIHTRVSADPHYRQRPTTAEDGSNVSEYWNVDSDTRRLGVDTARPLSGFQPTFGNAVYAAVPQQGENRPDLQRGESESKGAMHSQMGSMVQPEEPKGIAGAFFSGSARRLRLSRQNSSASFLRDDMNNTGQF